MTLGIAYCRVLPRGMRFLVGEVPPYRYLAARKARSGAGGGELRVERQGSEADPESRTLIPTGVPYKKQPSLLRGTI